jgi:hypothetical protein
LSVIPLFLYEAPCDSGNPAKEEFRGLPRSRAGATLSPRLQARSCTRVMANSRRTLCRLLALLALAFVGRCYASGKEPPFETAYSAIGAQVH